MLLKLILLFSLVPIIELALLIEVGKHLGVVFTVLLVGITGVVGVSLAKIQGLMVIGKIKSLLNQGKIPADELIGGLLILIGGAFLLTPGLLTDISGFALILPGSRHFFIKILKGKFKKYVKKHIHYQQFHFADDGQQETEEDDYIDVDYRDDHHES